MPGRKLRSLRFGLIASAGVGLLTLTAMINSAFAYGQIGDTASPTEEIPVQLTAYNDTISNAASDVASSYSSFFSDLPSLPPVILGLNIPGGFDAFANTTGVLPWDYAFGLTTGNAGGLGVEAWAPDNPLFSFVAESVGTTSGAWPGAASLVGVETPLGGFTNTESYANTFDPTGTTCLICNTFSLLAPGNSGNTDLFSFTADIPIGGSPQFELSTPLFSLGPDLGNAFDTSPLANGFVSDQSAASSSIAGDPAALINDLSTNLGPSIGNDLNTLLTNLSADMSTSMPDLLPGNLAADAATVIPTVLASLVP